MRAPYPKGTKQIMIRETRQNTEMGIAMKDGERDITLAEKIEEYVLRLGYSNAHVLSILIQLLTQGKIRVEFRTYVERLELVDLNDKISRSQAVSMIDDYINELQGTKTKDMDMNVTQRIIIQPPKRPQ